MGAVVGTEGVGTEKKVARFGLSVTVSDARASHLLDLALVYRLGFRFWLGRLCFALYFIWR